MPPMLFVGYDHPLTVLDQFFGGGQSGGRTTFMDAEGGGFFCDLSIATSSDLTFITLRPTISVYAPPSPQERAIARMFTKDIMALGDLLTPGP